MKGISKKEIALRTFGIIWLSIIGYLTISKLIEGIILNKEHFRVDWF